MEIFGSEKQPNTQATCLPDQFIPVFREIVKSCIWISPMQIKSLQMFSKRNQFRHHTVSRFQKTHTAFFRKGSKLCVKMKTKFSVMIFEANIKTLKIVINLGCSEVTKNWSCWICFFQWFFSWKWNVFSNECLYERIVWRKQWRSLLKTQLLNTFFLVYETVAQSKQLQVFLLRVQIQNLLVEKASEIKFKSHRGRNSTDPIQEIDSYF